MARKNESVSQVEFNFQISSGIKILPVDPVFSNWINVIRKVPDINCSRNSYFNGNTAKWFVGCCKIKTAPTMGANCVHVESITPSKWGDTKWQLCSEMELELPECYSRSTGSKIQFFARNNLGLNSCCSNFRNKSNGIFVLGVGFFLRQISTF